MSTPQIHVARRLQQTEEYYFSQKLREIEVLNKAGYQVINLGIGSPDLPPHPTVIETLKTYAQQENTHAYQGYKGITPFREAIAQWYQVFYQAELNPETEVLPLMGSKEGIMHLCMTFLEDGDEALIPNPGYPTYTSAVRISGATPIYYSLLEENNWLPDLKSLAKQDLSKVKLMWINYPHMPTGSQANESFYDELLTFAKAHNILICHDNPYSFILTDQPRSIMSHPRAKEHAIELNSLSKSSNMAGWRVGMMVGGAKYLADVLRFKSNMDSGMFMPIQMAAIAALNLSHDWYQELNAVYDRRRGKARLLLDLLNCTYRLDQAGMFIWAKIPKNNQDGYELSDKILNEAKVFITPGGIFGDAGNAFIRISLCAKETIFDDAIERIKKII